MAPVLETPRRLEISLDFVWRYLDPLPWGCFPQILSTVLGLSAGSAIRRLYHCVSRWDKRRCDVKSLIFTPLLISQCMQLEPEADTRTWQGHGSRVRRKGDQYCPRPGYEHGKTCPRYYEHDFWPPRRAHSHYRQVVGSGKVSAATHSWLVKLPTRPSSDYSNLESKHVQNTGLITNKNMAGNSPRPKSMIGPNMRSTLTHSYDPSWPESPPSCVVIVSDSRELL